MDLFSAASFSDVVFGLFLGLLGAVPFLHTNTLLAFFSSVGATSGPVGASVVSPLFAAVLAFSHLAFESLPAVFFGVPTADQGVSALPAQSLVRQGHGRTALDAVLQGLFGGLIGSALLAVPFWFFAPSVLVLVRPWTAWLLCAIVVVALALDGLHWRHGLSFLAFGALGVLVFDIPLQEPLFPLLSGLFGIPAVLFSGTSLSDVGGEKPPLYGYVIAAGSVLGCVSVFLPALSPSFLSALALLVFSSEPVAVIVLSSAISSSRMVFDFLGNVVLHTARSAPVAVWRDFHVPPADGVVMLALAVGAFVLAWLVVHRFWSAWLSALRSVPFDLLAVGLLVLVGLAAWVLDGPLGLFVLSWAACASILAQRLGVPRKYALGCLMVPAVMHALGI